MADCTNSFNNWTGGTFINTSNLNCDNFIVRNDGKVDIRRATYYFTESGDKPETYLQPVNYSSILDEFLDLDLQIHGIVVEKFDDCVVTWQLQTNLDLNQVLVTSLTGDPTLIPDADPL